MREERMKREIGEKTNPISGDATVGLLTECGFTDINRYFGSYLIEVILLLEMVQIARFQT
jgi:hypothetical protein